MDSLRSAYPSYFTDARAFVAAIEKNDRLTDTSGEVATSEFPRRAQLSRIPLTTDLVPSMRVRPMSRCTSLPSP